ncbi:cupin domain-containing protein [Amaricoccus sp.]|uniref:cupin domain-containing protein n=1 Tax=Amaricoccus sp. TaxID=1872485 RepID=UPI0026107BAE|nr:cupin domain-containing protein [Amaricoccus sp.]HRO12265.1 cupin domain-containing protein [Amaricoccus sp.]
MPTPARVHSLTRLDAPAAADAPPERVIAGSGHARVWNAFTGAGGRFHAGHWQAEPGRIAVDYAETELCVLLVGRVRLSDESGAAVDFGPGDAFVVEAGFRGTWESIGRVTKIYAVLDPEG